MKKEELESFGFDQEWLDEELNEHGTREGNLSMADFEFTKAIYEYGGKEGIDAYLDSTSHAYICANDLIRVVDSLFNASNYGLAYDLQDETSAIRYSDLVEKAVKEVFESMILALENAETEVQYDVDPLDRAENYIRGFGYGLIADIHKIISDDSEDETNEETA